MGLMSSVLVAEGEDKGANSYTPSWMVSKFFSANFGAANVPKEELVIDETVAKKDKKILVICTEKHLLKMANGTNFNTGHNISETLLPMLQLTRAGYEHEIATATGKPARFEDWSWAGPKANGYEATLRAYWDTMKGGFDAPITTAAALGKVTAGEYAAVFFPGGHGTMIEMHSPPDDGATGKILVHCHETQLTTITICHGPNSLRTAPKDTYAGYEIVAFPDSGDKQSPSFGYMPGQMTEFMTEELAKLHEGFKVLNKDANTDVHVHKELVSGAAPQAAHNLGLKAVEVLASKEDARI